MRPLTIILPCLLALVLPACQKDIQEAAKPPKPIAMQLNLPASAIVLEQYKSADTFLDFSWTGAGEDGEAQAASYTIEAGLQGSKFSDAVEIISTGQPSAKLTVKEFNRQMRQLMITGTTQMVEFRLRQKAGSATPVYSNIVALPVTTYQPITEYQDTSILRVPGSYCNWNVPSAPKIISMACNGEYEGYINFTDPNAQFWLVKGTQWENVTTYNATGPNSFGSNGNFFTPPSGAGVYRLAANTKTQTWTCTKINSWSLNGNAVSGDAAADAVMLFDKTSLTWRISLNLVKGDFVFRANKSNTIVFGHNAKSEAGIPESNAEPIRVTKAGYYTVVLSLQSAGNYLYSIQKNP
jgi:hypothetical protein